MYQKKSEWEKEFEKVMGCIPECASGLYEDVGCPAHGYDAMKAIKFFRSVLSNREKEIAEEVEGSVYAAFFSEAGEDDFEEYNNWRKNVLPGIILKHQ